MKPRFIDIHAHLNFEAFDNDWQDVIARTLEKNVWMIMPSSQYPTARKAIEMAKKYSQGVYAAVGFHPTHVLDHKWDKNAFDTLIKENKDVIVAVGETGLDNYRLPKDPAEAEESRKRQKQVLKDHIELAIRYHLPLIIHCRDAYDELLEILGQYKNDFTHTPPGVIHCFITNKEYAQKFIELGFFISFTGIITFTDDEKVLDAVRYTPLDRIMVETDAPYLTPVPYRGKRNEPLRTEENARKVAELKGISLDEVLTATTDNAGKVFGLQEKYMLE